MILITMAGLSSRFFQAGYQSPKYSLDLFGSTVFEWSINSFKRYFDSESFLFVIRPDNFSKNFLKESAQRLGISKYYIFQLNEDTRGQAETAYRALQSYDQDFPIIIFNIDTIRHNYQKPEFIDLCDGYLEVFQGEGTHWSFVDPGPDARVVRTTEKDRISDLCSDGLYYFRSQLEFCKVFEQALAENDQVRGEFYIAPLYNRIIKSGAIVKYELIKSNQLDFCGTPVEYESLRKKKTFK